MAMLKFLPPSRPAQHWSLQRLIFFQLSQKGKAKPSGGRCRNTDKKKTKVQWPRKLWCYWQSKSTAQWQRKPWHCDTDKGKAQSPAGGSPDTVTALPKEKCSPEVKEALTLWQWQRKSTAQWLWKPWYRQTNGKAQQGGGGSSDMIDWQKKNMSKPWWEPWYRMTKVSAQQSDGGSPDIFWQKEEHIQALVGALILYDNSMYDNGGGSPDTDW